MSDVKKIRWTEADVLALPAGEQDFFDRKSGQILNENDYRAKLAKALCAFANSGGGHVVLGMTDAGAFDGVPPTKGGTRIREWLEQIIPGLLQYPLQDFRVHEVEPAAPSTIPAGRVAIVIDVGDSAGAPHQTTDQSRTYFHRAGGHSMPASHFYLETLRNRLVNPTLSVTLADIRHVDKCASEGSVFVSGRLVFRVENIGRVAAYKWSAFINHHVGCAENREADYKYRFSDFPLNVIRTVGGIPLDETILPSLYRTIDREFGLQLRAAPGDADALRADVRQLLSEAFQVEYRVVTETSRGEPMRSILINLPGLTAFIEFASAPL